MATYSAQQLLDRSLKLTKNVDAYKVSDIISIGDKAKVALPLKSGFTFVLDSYLAPTPGYTSEYNIRYAARKYPYFTFFNQGVYYGIKLDSDRLFSLAALQAQGALTVEEEKKAREDFLKDDGNPFKGLGDWFGDLSEAAKKAIVLGIIIFILLLLLPFATSQLQKTKLKNNPPV